VTPQCPPLRFRALSSLFAWLPVLGSGCNATDAPAVAVEQALRSDLGVPASASLLSITSAGARRAPGTQQSGFGSLLDTYVHGPMSTTNGFRVAATFSLPLSAVDASYWSDWQPLPLPPATRAFRDPPSEVSASVGYYRCSVHSWSPGSTAGWTAGSCVTPPANFDSYEVAAYDPGKGTLTVVLKQYY
jgi:hypothetical protein